MPLRIRPSRCRDDHHLQDRIDKGHSGWRQRHPRLPLLLACLVVALLALVANTVRLSLLATASFGSSASACPSAEPPALASVGLAGIVQLRASLLPVVEAAGGKRYRWGTVSAQSAWSDDPPQPLAVSGERNGRWLASYEIREWAPAGYEVTADVYRFADARAARGFFAAAASDRCHRGGVVSPAAPPHARNLTWLNPDNFAQADVFLLRGPLVYRVTDLPPERAGVLLSGPQRRRASAIADSLACALADAGCASAQRAHALIDEGSYRMRRFAR